MEGKPVGPVTRPDVEENEFTRGHSRWGSRPRCGAVMPIAGERCARFAGHAPDRDRQGHRTQYALDNDRDARWFGVQTERTFSTVRAQSWTTRAQVGDGITATAPTMDGASQTHIGAVQ